MPNSNNFNSVVTDLSVFSSKLNLEALTCTNVPLETTLSRADELQTPNKQNKCNTTNAATEKQNGTEASSLAAQQLTIGFLQSYAPPLAKARGQLRELIQKQNKVYIDLSAEKFKLDNAEIGKLNEIMNSVKVYREKLLKIKKQMRTVYKRTNSLKKRAVNIQSCKEKELLRKLQKQQQEESLIAKQPQ